MVRPPFCDKLNSRKRGWVEEKEATSFSYLSKPAESTNWSCIPRKTGQKRCRKNCRLRWNCNYQRPDVNHEFTQHEEELIIKLHAAFGSRWGLIAHQLPGRTENDIKIHWNTKLRKKLTEMGIDPITHKPFFQILADYGNIGGLSRSSDTPKHIGTIRKDMKKSNTFTLPKQQSSTSNSYNFVSSSSLVSQNMSTIQLNYEKHSNNTHSLDLLSQLQAITLVTEGSNFETNNLPPHYNSCDLFELASPKSSLISSTSACSSNNTNNAGHSAQSPECFSWHDFLLDEAFKPAQNQAFEQEGSNLTEFMSISTGNEIQTTANQPLATSDASLFLQAMLDQENDMFLSFPGLMEEPLY